MDAYLLQLPSADESLGSQHTENYGHSNPQLKEHRQQYTGLSFPIHKQRGITPDSLTDGLEQEASLSQAGRQIKPAMDFNTVPQHWQDDQVFQPDMTPDSQNDEVFSPQSQGSSNAQPMNLSRAHSFGHQNNSNHHRYQHQQHQQQQQWSDLNSVFHANIEQAASFQMPSNAFVEGMTLDEQAALARQMHTSLMYSMCGSNNDSVANASDLNQFYEGMARGYNPLGLVSAAGEPVMAHLSGQSEMTNAQRYQRQQQRQHRQRQQQQQLLQHGQYPETDQRVDIAQPMAVHGSGPNQLSHVNQLSDQAERMGSISYTQPDAVGAGVSSDGSTASQPASVAAQSPSESESSQDALPEMVSRHPIGNDMPARRPSMTTDIARDMTHVHLKTESPEVPIHMQPVFKKPSLPQGATLAERRRQQLPNGLNVQRPKGLNLNRAFSSSAINVAPAGGRFPTSPHATLRRNRSSNVIAGSAGVLSGRIQKSGPSSARNSPLVGSFPEENGNVPQGQAQQQQPTPQTPTSGIASQTISVSAASQQTVVPLPDTPLPLSADPSVYTPGLPSAGSVQGNQSWLSTPITTPYGPSHTAAATISVKSQWPPASAVPQSAPAHVMTFPRDMSPPVMPSMPVTPAHIQFPQANLQAHMHMMPNSVGAVQVYPVVPSQPGLSENPGFIPAQQSHLMQMQQASAWGLQAPWMPIGNDPYGEHALWLMQNTCIPQKEIEVKLDAGCQRLRDEVSEHKARLLPVRPQEFSFQNTTTKDMKKALEDRE